jgi:two-component system, OmpR family, sensor kinase
VRRLPIRLRLTLPFAAAMAIALAGMGLFVYLRVGSALLASVDQNLRAQVGELRSQAEHGQSLADRDAAGAATVGELVRADGSVVRSTRPHLAPLLPPRRRARVLAGHVVKWSSEIPGLRGTWRLLAAQVVTARGDRALVAAASLSARDEALDRLARELVLGGPLALVIAIVCGYLVAAAALGPVEAMRARAEAITASTPGRRLPVTEPRDELARLAATLNDMLGRLEAAFAHERRFVADASHELRTPLAMLRTELEVALRRPRSNAELEEALRSAAEEAERLSQLAEDLLLIARSDQGKLPVRAESVDARDVLDTVAARHASSARERRRSVSVTEVPDVSLEADRTRLEQALGNLVTNALSYGAGAVELSVWLDDGQLEFHVTDEGPGFSPDFIPRAFDRFSRADEARGTGGTGLGLAIVELIAEAHGGTAGLANRRGRGADVWIRLPRTVEQQSAAATIRTEPG